MDQPMSRRRREVPRGAVIADRYEVVAAVGRGAMSTVYYAHDRKTDQAVALKMLHANRVADKQAVLRFEREATAARGVSHPCVVKYLDAGRSDGVPYGVMELADGETLAQYVAAHGALDMQRAVMLTRRLASGLAAIHATGIVHRDIKPSNLLLVFDEAGIPTSLKIADFGLVKILHSSITWSGVIMGTASFMAPEQILGEEVDERADVYAVGIVFFHALTGELPFTGRNITESMAHQLHSKAPPPSWFVDSLPPGFEAVVGKALRKQPEERYQSMVDFAQDLDALRAGPQATLQATAAEYGPDVYEPRTKRGGKVLLALRRALR